jgi:hypothetical protein
VKLQSEAETHASASASASASETILVDFLQSVRLPGREPGRGEEGRETGAASVGQPAWGDGGQRLKAGIGGTRLDAADKSSVKASHVGKMGNRRRSVSSESTDVYTDRAADGA